VKAGERAEGVGGRGGGRVATGRARGARVGDVRPRGGRRLPRRHDVASAHARGRAEAGADAGASASAEQAGPASALGPERRRRPDMAEKVIFFSK
jgi:hypothetical protein